MVIRYKLNRDIVARTAANFCFELNKFKTTIYLINKTHDTERIVNAKSLIGLLQSHLRVNDIIELHIDDIVDDVNKIKEIFMEIGREIKWLLIIEYSL